MAAGEPVMQQAPGTPEFRVNLLGEWDTPFVPNLTLTGQIIHTSKQYLDSENTLTIPDWTRVDVGARYLLPISGHSATLRARIINLLDENYWETSSLNLGEPRTFIMSVSLAF